MEKQSLTPTISHAAIIEEKRNTQSISAYVRKLIRWDMNNIQETQNFEQIYEYLEKRLQKSGFVVKDTVESKMIVIVDEVDKDVILDLI